MTRDSDGGRPQKTVAELLAEHGGQVGGAPRRRRRRAADDDDEPMAPGQSSISDTAPQAIIERVRGEGPPPGMEQPGGAAPEQAAEPPQRARAPRAVPPAPPQPQGTGGYPVPPPDDGGRPPLPQRPPGGAPQNGMPNGVAPPTRRVQPVAPPPDPPGSDGGLSARLDGLEEPAAPERPQAPQPPQPPQGTGGYPVPPPPKRRRPPRGAPLPPPEPNTEEFPALGGVAGQGAPDAGIAPDEPPAGLAGWRRRKRDAQRDAQLEDTEVGVTPVVPQGAQQGDLAPEVDDDGGPPTGFYVPDFAGEGAENAQPFRAGVLDDDPLAGPDALHEGYEEGWDERADRYDQYENYADYDDYEEYQDYADAEDAEDSEDSAYEDEQESRGVLHDVDDVDDAAVASPAKQWLVLAGQLALGVVGGAAVWLGFNWLWGQLPAAALVAALVVTVGLVWIVRKVRRADDLQTTVLALLVGLVVTVSPAALLLVSR